MSPCGDIAVCVQRWNGSPLMNGAGLPEMPSVSSTFPASALADGMVAVIGEPDSVVWRHERAVRARE
jgi:hypothetical protein